MPTDPRYQVPIPDDVMKVLKGHCDELRAKLPPGWGFTLLLFSYGEGGLLTYMSSAERHDMIKTMMEFIQRQVEA